MIILRTCGSFDFINFSLSQTMLSQNICKKKSQKCISVSDQISSKFHQVLCAVWLAVNCATYFLRGRFCGRHTVRAFHVFLLKVSVGKIFPNRERSFLTGFFHLRNRSSRGRSVKKKEKKFAEVAPGGSSKPDLVLGKNRRYFHLFSIFDSPRTRFPHIRT